MNKKPLYKKKPKPSHFSYSSHPIPKLTIDQIKAEMLLRFYWAKNLPLSIGFINEMIAHYKSKIEFGTHHLRKLVAEHCRSKRYLSKLRTGYERYDFNGNKTSFVTEEQEAQAKLHLRNIKVRKNADRKQDTPPHQRATVHNSKGSS